MQDGILPTAAANLAMKKCLGKAVIAANAAKLQKLTRMILLRLSHLLSDFMGWWSWLALVSQLTTSSRSKRHNALGVLKKTFPNSTQWMVPTLQR